MVNHTYGNTGGMVVISGPFMPSMHKAQRIMTEHCSGPYEYTELGNPVSAIEFQCK